MAPVMTKNRGALLSLQMSLLIFLTPITNNALLNIKPIRQKYFLFVLLMLSCLYCKPSWYIAGKRPSSLYSYSIIHKNSTVWAIWVAPGTKVIFSIKLKYATFEGCFLNVFMSILFFKFVYIVVSALNITQYIIYDYLFLKLFFWTILDSIHVK